jgi:hypothetical protein
MKTVMDMQHRSQDDRESLAEQIEDAFRHSALCRQIEHQEAKRQGSFRVPATD